MAIDLDVNSFTELNNNIVDINNKTAPLANMVLNPVPVGSSNKLAVKRGTTWNIEGEEAYNGRLQNFGDISGNVSLDMDGAGCRTAMIAEVIGDTFITGFGDNFSSGVVYVLFLRQDSTGGHSVRWPYGASILGMAGTGPDQLTEVYIVKLPNGKVFIKCKAFQNTVEIGSIIKEFEYPSSKYPENGGSAPISFTWSKNPEIAYGGTLSGLYSDWEVASDELFTVLMFSSYGNTVDLYSIEVVLSQSGLAYMRTRYGGEIGGTPVVSPWEQMAVQVSGVPPLWTPADIDTTLWLDAEDMPTITLSGSAVSMWADKSGNNNHAVQNNAAKQPTVGENFNGRRALSFDGGDVLETTKFFDIANAVGMMFCVFEHTEGTSKVIMSTRHLTTHNGWTWRVNSTSEIIYFHAGVSGAVTINRNSGKNLASITRNGLLVSPGVGGMVGPEVAMGNLYPSDYGKTSIGAENSGSLNFFLGLIGEIIVVSGSVDAEVRKKTEGYLAHKWGLTADLPDDHPYKYAPPRKFNDSEYVSLENVTKELWLDALDASSVILDSGAVKQWNDKSGKERHNYQETLSLRPLYDGNSLVFNGTNWLSSLLPLDLTSGFSFFCVCMINNTKNWQGFFRIASDLVDTVSDLEIYRQKGTANGGNLLAVVHRGTYSDMAICTYNNAPPLVGTNHQFYFQVPNSSDVFMGIDGKETANPTLNTSTMWFPQNSNNYYVGVGYSKVPTCYLYGKICEILVLGSGIFLEDRKKVEGYLAHKWGLTANLPEDHPYKNTKPESTKYETDTTTIIAGNILEGTPGLTITKVNGDALNLGVQVAGTSGGLFQIYANGSWTFYPNDEFSNLFVPDTLDSSVSYHTTDGVNEFSKTLNVIINGGAVPNFWTPKEIQTFVWLDASDTESIVLSGEKVQTWSDLSGNARHYTTTTPNITTLPGKYVEFYNQSWTWALYPSSGVKITGASSSFFSFFVVKGTQIVKACSDANSGTCVGSGGCQGCITYADQPPAGFGEIIGINGVKSIHHRSGTICATNNVAYDDTDFFVVLFVYSGSVSSIYINGEFKKSGVAFNTSDRYLSLGVGPYGNFGGYVCEHILGDFVPDADTIDRLFGYAAHKWDKNLDLSVTLVSKMPENHPYKLNPPTSTAQESDPYWPNVALLIQPADGTLAGSTDIIDRSPSARPLTLYGDSQVSVVLGVPKVLFDGTGDYITAPHDSVFNFNTTGTLEFLITPTTVSKMQILMTKLVTGNYATGFQFLIREDGSLGFIFYYGTGLYYKVDSAVGSIVAGGTYHIALTRGADYVTRLHLNGVYVGQVTQTATRPPANTAALVIGREPGNTARDYQGHMRIRWTSGAARYDTNDNFTPLTKFQTE